MRAYVSMLFVTALLLLTTSTRADAAEPYVKLIGGFGSLDDGGTLAVDTPGFADGAADADYETSLSGGFGVGVDVGRFTFELDYLYRSSEFEQVRFADGSTVSDGNFASVTIGGNAYYRWRPNTKVQPYLGAGVGWVQEVDVDFEENGMETSFETDDFGLQLTAGVRWQLGKRWLFDAQVRWLDVQDVTMDAEFGAGTIRADYTPTTVLLSAGWRW